MIGTIPKLYHCPSPRKKHVNADALSHLQHPLNQEELVIAHTTTGEQENSSDEAQHKDQDDSYVVQRKDPLHTHVHVLALF